MMKIGEVIRHLGQAKAVAKDATRTAKDNKSFHNILDGALQTTAKQAETVAPAVSGRTVVPVGSQRLPEAQARVFKKASNLLKLLEEYERGLRDHSRTLKSLGPLVGDLRARAEGIEAEEDLGDNPLSRLARDIAATAVVQAFKFERGDYLE